jgi:hypothetical protein
MTLDNLIGKLLERITPDSAAIQRLLEAAYKAIMQLSNAALQAAGFRTLTSKPGHHQATFHKACSSL